MRPATRRWRFTMPTCSPARTSENGLGSGGRRLRAPAAKRHLCIRVQFVWDCICNEFVCSKKVPGLLLLRRDYGRVAGVCGADDDRRNLCGEGARSGRAVGRLRIVPVRLEVGNFSRCFVCPRWVLLLHLYALDGISCGAFVLGVHGNPHDDTAYHYHAPFSPASKQPLTFCGCGTQIKTSLEDKNPTSCDRIAIAVGIRKAAVFPLPVCAQTMRSNFFSPAGMAYFWTGVGRV